MPETKAARRWRALLLEQAESGLSNREFAEKKDVNPRTLASWRSRLKYMEAEPKGEPPALLVPRSVFTEVTMARRDRTLVLALEDFRAHVVVDEDTDLVLLRALLGAVA